MTTIHYQALFADPERAGVHHLPHGDISDLLAGAMALEHIGKGDLATRLRGAIASTLNGDGIRTPDLGGSTGTEAFTAAIIHRDEVEVVGRRGVLLVDLSVARGSDAGDAFALAGARLSYLERGDRVNLRTLEPTPSPAKLAAIERLGGRYSCMFIGGIAACVEYSQTDGPIERAGVEPLEPEMPGDAGGNRALAGRRGSIDGDDHGRVLGGEALEEKCVRRHINAWCFRFMRAGLRL